MNCARLALQLVVLYLLVSGLEWVIHAKIMHGDPDTLRRLPLCGERLSREAESHLMHHRIVGADMRMETDNHKNLHLAWNVTIICALVLAVMMWLTGLYSTPTILFAAPACALLVSYMWNSWHSRFHAKEISSTIGIPNRPELPNDNWLYRFLWKYHALHHTQKGIKYNFNITCPGFDLVMGTYLDKCYNNVDFCKKSPKLTAACKGKLKHCYSDVDVLSQGTADLRRFGEDVLQIKGEVKHRLEKIVESLLLVLKSQRWNNRNDTELSSNDAQRRE